MYHDAFSWKGLLWLASRLVVHWGARLSRHCHRGLDLKRPAGFSGASARVFGGFGQGCFAVVGGDDFSGKTCSNTQHNWRGFDQWSNLRFDQGYSKNVFNFFYEFCRIPGPWTRTSDRSRVARRAASWPGRNKGHVEVEWNQRWVYHMCDEMFFAHK